VAEQRERFRVAWIDTDTGGRIHFTAAFRWAEATETSLYRRLGLLRGQLADYPRRHVEADYLRVLRFEDEVEVRLRVAKVGRTSVTFSWDVLHEGEVSIRGTHTVVRVDEGGRPKPIDDRHRERLLAEEP